MLKYIKKIVNTRSQVEMFVIGYSGREIPYSAEKLAKIEVEIKNAIIKPAKKEKQLELIRLFKEYLKAKAEKESTKENIFSEEYFKNPSIREYLCSHNGLKPTSEQELEWRRRMILLGHGTLLNLIGGYEGERRFDNYKFGGLCDKAEPIPINKETIMHIHNYRLESLKKRVADVEATLNEKIEELAKIWGKFPSVPSSKELRGKKSVLNRLRGQLKGMGNVNSLDPAHTLIYYSLETTVSNLEIELGRVEYKEKQGLLEDNPNFFDAYDTYLEFYESLRIVQKRLALYEARYILEPDMVELEIEWEIEAYNKCLEHEERYKDKLNDMETKLAEHGYSFARKYRPAMIKKAS